MLASFAKTNRMVIAHEAVVDFGVGAEIAARAVDADSEHRRAGRPGRRAAHACAVRAAAGAGVGADRAAGRGGGAPAREF